MANGDNRLKHSRAGVLRYLQMSQIPLFIFVEGTEFDPYFYGSICSKVVRGHSIRYEVLTANQLPNSSGGKSTLRAMHDFLESNGSLLGAFKGKSTAVLFYVDKDLDDVHATQCQSSHFVYTRHYDVENYVYIHGDLVRGSAVAASRDPNSLPSELASNRDWCLSAAQRWEKWVSLCYFTHTRGVSGEANYGRCSPINCTPGSPTDPDKYVALVYRVRQSSGLSECDFAAAYLAARKTVRNYFINDRHDSIFKGKWYSYILAEDISSASGGGSPHGSHVQLRLTPTIAMTLDFDASWADHLKQPLRDIIGQLGL